MTYRVSPGVYNRIDDETIEPVVTNPNIAAMVFGHTRGPLGPYMVTGVRDRKLRYGLNNPSWGHGIDALDAFLLQGTQAYGDRTVSADSSYGLGLICNNTVAGQPQGTSFTSIPAGSLVPYDQLNRQVLDVEFTGQFAAGSSCTVTINGTATPAVPFTTDHDTTMMMIEQAVQNVLDGLEPGGLAWLVPVGASEQLLRVIGPQAITLALSAATTGNGAPVAQVRAADWLCFTVAQNPGSWSGPDNQWGYNGVAVGITNVDVGVSQRVRLGFSSAVLVGQSITMVANGVTVTTPFATNNNQTLINFCADYAQAFPGGSAQVVPAATGSNNLQVMLVAPSADESLEITELQVTGNGTRPTVTFAVTLSPVRSSGAFTFVVYENPNFVVPDEQYQCTFQDGTDGLGNPTGLDYVINGVNPTTGVRPLVSPSSRVAVTVNPLFSGTVNGATGVTNSNLERYLSTGADGSIPSTQQIVTGWNDFSDPEAVTVRLLVNCGYASPEVHQQMMAISAKRMDCFSILDTPSNLQDPQDAAAYRQTQMAVNSFWGAIYSPDILIYDADIGRRRYVPPSGQVAAQYAYNDRVASQFAAPAGLTRGILASALDCRYHYNEGDRDALSQAQVNAIRFIDDAWTIWGEYTLQVAESSLSSVPVVRLVIEVVTEASTACAYSVFEPNNRFTWQRVTSTMDGVLQPIEDADGLTDYLAQCDETVNTPEIIQQRVMRVLLWLKPVLCVLYIALDLIISRQDATFTISEVPSIQSF